MKDIRSRIRSHNIFLVLAVLVVASLALAVAPAAADTITRSFDVAPGGALHIDTDRGAIEVRSGAAGKVTVTVTREGDKAQRLKLDFDQRGNDVIVRGDYPKTAGWFDWGSGQKIEFVATVPEGTNVDLKTSGGSITIGDVMGKVDAETSGGSIHINQTRGDVHAETSGGSVNISRAGGSVVAKTSGGSINVEEVMGEIRAHTSGGSVSATITKQPAADCSLTTSGGGISVRLAKNIALDLDASTSGGRVRSELQLSDAVMNRYHTSLRGQLNGGGPNLVLHTSGGSIRIEKD